ncbi:putative isoprenylcysteine alpha-carbonyl methylesterase icmel1 [Fusarium sporotrichioides]|uniref:Putative isoprenylcysteine alpha-carbonyl methylesterase icmel1 n=1 Tax=Fusarium sporotrichioides TaxID=5514 RepID=A0A395RT35_FUSSP|nr:putative isoprenylcysteine alpha-carbonyl methylesterase icmel1 [Fusarium sporotrichioides]
MASVAVSSENSNPKSIFSDAATRGTEITGLSIYQDTNEDITHERAQDLMSAMNADVPQGGKDIVFGNKKTQRLRFWEPTSNASKAPIVVFVHGGSWTIGTYLDSVGSLKVKYLNDLGYAFASVDFALIPTVTVKEQVQEVADAVAHIMSNSQVLGIDPERVVLMGHSSGAHVASLVGTDPGYAQKAGFDISRLAGIIALDGSNYNAAASIADNTGSIVTNMLSGLGSDPDGLDAMSPTLHAGGPNARAFLLLHVQRKGDIRQAVEFSSALRSAGTRVNLHVFEGEGFEGHIALLLRIGDEKYPATVVLEQWLERHAPVQL